MRPDPDDVRQEVELQRLLGRRVSARHVRLRLMREEADREAAEREYASAARSSPLRIDPVRFPILYDKLVRRLTPRELLEAHNCRSRQTLSRKVRLEINLYREENP